MNQQTAENRYDAALGCFLGACVGDAAGAILEFLGYKPSMLEVQHAMTMPGSEIFGLASGQITDDTELALCLAQALATSGDFNLEKIAQNYASWIETPPFDMGFTISKSLGCFRDSKWRKVCETEGYAAAMTKAAVQRCTDSKANGSLMRIAPLGIWGSRLDTNELAQAAIKDSRLSHPNESCCHAVACYVIAIANLIENQGDRSKAFSRVIHWANSHANDEVRCWLQNAKDNVEVPYYPQAGFVQIAFVHAFRHLLLGTSYQDAIQETLSGGGDTDTNACIVGGLVGAACGASSIPENMKQPVLYCETQQGQYPRPAFLHSTQLLELTERLLLMKNEK
jgi:ADP-ribosyl-[dinitrogen reductase] hydrolase